jgi:hypothetical protein
MWAKASALTLRVPQGDIPIIFRNKTKVSNTRGLKPIVIFEKPAFERVFLFIRFIVIPCLCHYTIRHTLKFHFFQSLIKLYRLISRHKNRY